MSHCSTRAGRRPHDHHVTNAVADTFIAMGWELAEGPEVGDRAFN